MVNDPSPTSPNKTTSPKLAQFSIYGDPITPLIASKEPNFLAFTKKLIQETRQESVPQAMLPIILREVDPENDSSWSFHCFFFHAYHRKTMGLIGHLGHLEREQPQLGDLLTMELNHWN